MYVVFAEELDVTPAKTNENTVSTLDQAFARICCHCGLSYRFVPEDEGWRLELVDVERPNAVRSRFTPATRNRATPSTIS